MKLFSSIKKFFDKRYWIFLVMVVLISYGQMLWMQPWQDDNALFFKLAHIQDLVGFFGKGPLGEGVYKYAAVPFIPIYHFFGFYVPAYFALLLVLYALTALVVYKVFSKVFGETGGRMTGFIYATGYITSDSFWRMANSATTSISIMLVALFFYLYWKYYKEEKIRYYFFALISFFVAVNYSIARNHYLFAIAVLFELIFLAFRKQVKSVIFSFLRLIPFAYVFYHYVILASDARAGGVMDFVKSILHGQLNVTFGVISSVANLVIPDYLSKSIFSFLGQGSFAKLILFAFGALAIYLILRMHDQRKLLTTIFLIILSVWYFTSKSIYSTPLINPGERQLFIVSLGGILILIASAALFALRSSWKIFLFLSLWLLINATAYSTYYPTIVYDTINRYLAHSFFAYAGILGFLYSKAKKERNLGKLAGFAIIVFGILNLFSAVKYQKNVLETRSYPVARFYQDLAKLLPKINKGDILYFDLSNGARGYYSEAISAAMMPDTASFAWRYGIDRYDFSLVTDFKELNDLIGKDKVDSSGIHSYWYSGTNLVDTSGEVQNYFSHKKETLTSDSILNENLSRVIPSAVPNEIRTIITAFPPVYDPKIYADRFQSFTTNEIEMVFKYKLSLEDFIKNSTFEVTSSWQDRAMGNLYDNDLNTVWQPDRVLWQDKKEYLKVRLPQVENINRVYFTTGDFRDSFVTDYEISISLDGQNWQNVKVLNSIDNATSHIVEFSPQEALFVKMDFKKTLGDEAPMIAEFRVIPDSLSSLDLFKAQAYLEKPFDYVLDENSFNLALSSLNYMGRLKVYWQGDKEVSWQTINNSEFEAVYDGLPHEYTFILPAGGTKVNKIRFSNETILGSIHVDDFSYRAQVE